MDGSGAGKVVAGGRERPFTSGQPSTSLVSDVLGDLGLPAQALAPSIRPITHGPGTVVGWATTVLGNTGLPGSGPDLVKASAIDAMDRGSFAIWAGGGVQDVCLFGDLLSAGQRARGVVGAIVDGGVRDVAQIEATGFPVWARYVTPRASTGIWRASAVNVTVRMPGTLGAEVEVTPGDLVVADRDGVVIIPSARLEDVRVGVARLLARETDIRARVDRGDSIADLLRQHGRI